MTELPTTRKWMRPKEARAHLDISEATFWRWKKTKVLRTKKVEGVVFVDIEFFEKKLAEGEDQN